jgi:hypothetical protein
VAPTNLALNSCFRYMSSECKTGAALFLLSSECTTNMQENKFGLGSWVRVCIIDDKITVATKTSFIIPPKM